MNNSEIDSPLASNKKPVNPTLTDRFDYILGITDPTERLEAIIRASREIDEKRNEVKDRILGTRKAQD